MPGGEHRDCHWEHEAQRYAGNADYWRDRAESVEAERDRYREALESVRDGRPFLSYAPGIALAMEATRYGWSLAAYSARIALEEHS